jgi:hypothetical protein
VLEGAGGSTRRGSDAEVARKGSWGGRCLVLASEGPTPSVSLVFLDHTEAAGGWGGCGVREGIAEGAVHGETGTGGEQKCTRRQAALKIPAGKSLHILM